MNHSHSRPPIPIPARLAVFGSGAGSNARAIIEWVRNASIDAPYDVVLIVSTSPSAGINDVARAYGLPLLVLERSMPVVEQTDVLLQALREHAITIVALAGYLRKVEPAIIHMVGNHILNIHPSLLPAYGGQGMYGATVHQAVLAAGETETGVTVHLVTDVYDDGAILAQQRVPVLDADTVSELAARVRNVEHLLYPSAIAAYVREMAEVG
ncbi:MAG: phosphoribosylglycinamide formyltransferase [Candidatus Kapabacteria bacterium]|nr:phosphoribosylglycinamide formyltransferase [Candidatus Kapabacteria bacterium]